jgi:hypothetical protein
VTVPHIDHADLGRVEVGLRRLAPLDWDRVSCEQDAAGEKLVLVGPAGMREQKLR